MQCGRIASRVVYVARNIRCCGASRSAEGFLSKSCDKMHKFGKFWKGAQHETHIMNLGSRQTILAA
jgi:hypothetical protein